MTVTIDADVNAVPSIPVQQQVLYFPVGNDVQVTVQYPNISDGTGSQSEFYYKDNRYTPDNDPASVSYAAPIVPDPDNAGATMSTFMIPSEDNGASGAFWWRVDFVDSNANRTTVGFGTLLVEAV